MSYLSVSQMSEWLACKHRWKLGYRHELKPKVTHPAIVLGGIVHQALEAGYRSLFHYPGVLEYASGEMGMAIEEAIDQQDLVFFNDEEYQDVFDRAMAIANRGIRTFDTSENGRWKVAEFDRKPAVEVHIEVPLAGWDGFQGYLDLILQDKLTGTYFIADHKVRRTFIPNTAEETNLQNSMYQYMTAFHGMVTAGTLTHQISSAEEQTPKLTQKGDMSRAQIKCTWETYRACLLEEGLDPDDYVEMADKLKGEFVRVDSSFRSTLEIQNVWRHIVLPVAQEIRTAKMQIGDPILPRVFNHRECNGCLFRAPCIGEIRGDDVNHIIQEHYEQKKGRWKPREEPTRQETQ